MTTFDCVSELHKIAAGYPSFKCVLRIRCDDASAKINLGLKYGADMCDVPMLLGLARDLGLQVVGVSFHVGSGCQNVGVYADAIAAARQVGFVGNAQAVQRDSICSHTHQCAQPVDTGCSVCGAAAAAMVQQTNVHCRLCAS
jgi:diaminopimelate decarboxylase